MKLRFLALMSCLFFFSNISFSAPVDERKKLIKKLPCEQRKIVRQFDKATTLPTISEIHLKKEKPLTSRELNRIAK